MEEDPDEIEDEAYECNICKLNFTDIEKHLAEFHDDKVVAIELTDSPTKSNFECKKCHGKIFKSFKRFIVHIRTHNEATEEEIKALEDKYTKKQIDDDMCEKIDISTFRCKICNSEFETRKRLLLHISIHRNVAAAHKRSDLIQKEKLINCQHCNRTFNSEAELEMHTIAHDSIRSEIIEKRNVTKSTKGIHACQYCGKEFKRPHEKVKHERVHTNEKPHGCDVRRRS